MRSKAMDYDRAPPVSLDLINPDLMPTAKNDRTWDWKAIAALWVGMVVCVPAYMIAAGLVAEGMSWKEAVGTILLANLIVLIPMIAIGHAGTKHGIPFPVLLRASFGTRGAKVPALLRGLVACGWFGIQTWVGGAAIYAIANILTFNALDGEPLPFLGIDAGQTACFLGFWLLHVWFIRNGTESIRWLELWAAPVLIAMCGALLYWAWDRADGFGAMLSTPSKFAPGGEREGQFFSVFWPSLTAMVGFWATLALNIPDFTRFARSQRDQVIGQALGLPIPMAALAFVGVAVTSATVVIFGEAIWDPVKLTERMGGVGVILALFALVLATITTNLAANVVAPANGFSNLSPRRISFKTGGYITAGIGIAMFPWKLLESTGAYIFTWLIGYSALLGPIAGIMLADYFILRRTELDAEELFKEGGRYSYRGGWNPVAFVALIAGVLPNLPGFLKAAGFATDVPPIFDAIYAYAWFVGLVVAAAVYLMFSKREK
ncbi:MAG TPA: NCS1 family nucleobase:cation symporter-1 [Patescibacteria group bacterium]|nr:NCS1 family nucleobase:cation symporter-1 [Patescibacteria group bacterium]